MIFAAIIVAAGRGIRAGGAVPKQWQDLHGKSIAARSAAKFTEHPAFTQVVVVVNANDEAAGLCADLPPCAVVHGGATRAASVQAGLAALHPEITHVLIHDAARPLVSNAVIHRVIDALSEKSAAAPAVAVSDTLWRGQNGHVLNTQDRDGLFRAQTPQGFEVSTLRAAHAQASGQETDDVSVVRAAGVDVAIVLGDEDNIKITTPDDFARARRLMSAQMDVRCGNGYDVHRFGDGNSVWLCGVNIPHTRGLQGHSDADVGMHAITDAIYGALGRGDIGQHFPPSDPQWKGADSKIFLQHACALARDLGFQISNVDCTLVCEYPKIGPHQPAMTARLAEIMGLDVARISVKATTSERLGFTGREEGIAAIATATLVSA